MNKSSAVKVAFLEQTKKLAKLLQEDQDEARKVSRETFWNKPDGAVNLDEKRAEYRRHITQRTDQMLQILDEIGEPSITNVGAQGAIAISVLATHHSLKTTQQVLAAFMRLYEEDPKNTHYKSIPAMTDWSCILERKPQKFGTIWLFDANKEPYLPIVEDFEHVNERRKKYGIEPLRWPKSLAIPEEEQPWLRQPIAKLVMREPTDKEYEEVTKDYID